MDFKLRGRRQDITELKHFKFPIVRLALYIYTLIFIFESVTMSDINTQPSKTTEDTCFMGEILTFFSCNKMGTPERGCGSGTWIIRY